jgi:hypothetical protein
MPLQLKLIWALSAHAWQGLEEPQMSCGPLFMNKPFALTLPKITTLTRATFKTKTKSVPADKATLECVCDALASAPNNNQQIPVKTQVQVPRCPQQK